MMKGPGSRLPVIMDHVDQMLVARLTEATKTSKELASVTLKIADFNHIITFVNICFSPETLDVSASS
jgi:hypothetical protein